MFEFRPHEIGHNITMTSFFVDPNQQQNQDADDVSADNFGAGWEEVPGGGGFRKVKHNPEDAGLTLDNKKYKRNNFLFVLMQQH